MRDHEYFMNLAMEEAEKSFEEGSFPFSVVVVNHNWEVVRKDHDRVNEFMDPTAHAEVNAIRHLCKTLNTLNLRWYTFYTSSEPCPTCLSSCIKAKVSTIYYGAETEENASLPIKAKYLASLSKKYPIEVFGWILWNECHQQRASILKKIDEQSALKK